MIVGGEVQVVVFSDWLFVWVWEMRRQTSSLISLNPPGGLSQRSAIIMIHFTRTKINVNDLKGVKAPNYSPWQLSMAGSWCQYIQGTDKRHLWILMLPYIVNTTNQFGLRPPLSSLRDRVLICGQLFAFCNGSWNPKKQLVTNLVCKCQVN